MPVCTTFTIVYPFALASVSKNLFVEETHTVGDVIFEIFTEILWHI